MKECVDFLIGNVGHVSGLMKKVGSEMESVESALEQLILDVAQSIRGAKTVHTVTRALRSVASLLWSPYQKNNPGNSFCFLCVTFGRY